MAAIEIIRKDLTARELQAAQPRPTTQRWPADAGDRPSSLLKNREIYDLGSFCRNA
jgi:hypothetical protein